MLRLMRADEVREAGIFARCSVPMAAHRRLTLRDDRPQVKTVSGTENSRPAASSVSVDIVRARHGAMDSFAMYARDVAVAHVWTRRRPWASDRVGGWDHLRAD